MSKSQNICGKKRFVLEKNETNFRMQKKNLYMTVELKSTY